MQLPSAFNADKHEKMGDFTPLPKSDYITQITKSEMKLTKKAIAAKEAGDSNFQQKGQMLVLTHTVLAPKAYKGKTVNSRLNLVNSNDTTVEIANKELATICAAVGKVSIEDSDELHGIPMLISVDVTDDEKYNEIKFYDKCPADVPEELLAGVGDSPSGADNGTPGKRLWD